ncbi:MAG: hypothetical protein PF541_02300 [Prolixibacteraceae bacterium]|jgi:hypothetical protein|nr:hypothetical protein [Prolixibacteraceae bacterium]
MTIFIFRKAKLLGREAVFPMIATYVVLHFGKPMGEAVGAVFMGYILGVIAFEGKNIWGGIIFRM